MRLSRYAIVGVEQDHAWLFGAVRGDFAWLPRDWGLALAEGRLDPLPPRLRVALLRRGFLVPDGVDEYAAALRRVRLRRARQPLNLIVVPTYACNLRCGYCYAQDVAFRPDPRADGDRGDDLRSRLAAFLERRLPALQDRRLTLALFGGEPLLRSGACLALARECAQAAARHGARFFCTLTTNGSLLDDDTRCLFAHLSSCQVTLDGVGADHDRYRHGAAGEGSYERIVAFVRAASEAGVGVGIRFHLHPEFDPRGWPDAAARLRRDLGPLNKLTLYFADVSPGGFRETIGCDHWGPGHAPSVERAPVREAFLQAGWPAEQVQLNLAGNDDLVLDRRCLLVGEGTYLVDGRGDVYVCPVALGDAATRLGRLDRAGRLHAPRLQRLTRALTPPRMCAECRLFPICEMGCLVKAAARRGSLDEPFCERGPLLQRVREKAQRLRPRGAGAVPAATP